MSGLDRRWDGLNVGRANYKVRSVYGFRNPIMTTIATRASDVRQEYLAGFWEGRFRKYLLQINTDWAPVSRGKFVLLHLIGGLSSEVETLLVSSPEEQQSSTTVLQ